MRQRFVFVLYCLAIMLALVPQRTLGQRAAPGPYSFACRSSKYMLDDFDKQPSVPSPDKMKAVQLTKHGKFRVSVGRTIVSDLDLPDISCNVEVGWSPDSSQFFISYSDGGAVGSYHVYLYQVVGSSLEKSRVPKIVAERFKRNHWCNPRGNNLFFLDWTPDSKVAFLVGEVYPTGDCGKELGVFRGYAVRVRDGKILRILGEKPTESIEKKCRTSGRLVLPSE